MRVGGNADAETQTQADGIEPESESDPKSWPGSGVSDWDCVLWPSHPFSLAKTFVYIFESGVFFTSFPLTSSAVAAFLLISILTFVCLLSK